MRSPVLHRFLFCVALLCNVLPVRADITYDNYLELELIKAAGTAKHGANAFELDNWLDGVATGISWSMTFARIKGRDRIICLPPTLPLTGEIVHSVINQHLERRPTLKKPDTDMGRVAVEGLQVMFPCTARP